MFHYQLGYQVRKGCYRKYSHNTIIGQRKHSIVFHIHPVNPEINDIGYLNPGMFSFYFFFSFFFFRDILLSMDIFDRTKHQEPFGVDPMFPWIFRTVANFKDLSGWTKCLSEHFGQDQMSCKACFVSPQQQPLFF